MFDQISGYYGLAKWTREINYHSIQLVEPGLSEKPTLPPIVRSSALDLTVTTHGCGGGGGAQKQEGELGGAS